MRQLALPMRLRASSVFDSFYRGRNESTVQQLLALTTGGRAPAVWLYGAGGVGKTHLLQAVCARAGQAAQTAAYLPLRDGAARDAELLVGCEELAFTCLDDFDARAGDALWERALFRLYTELEDRGGRLLIAAAGPPAAMPIKLRDLASRLAAGAILRLAALDDDEQRAALQLRATQLGLELPDETALYLLRRVPRDMHSLCGVLATLDEASLASQRRLTVPFVRATLDEAGA